ncbi:MAG: hypothetical protein JXQ29_01795 [Planctomycetes bacterium]|nr:hypothetical protein [Planctomycetota bacterium]
MRSMLRLPAAVLAALSIALAAVSASPQNWVEYPTHIELPPRDVAHPLDLLAASDGRVLLAWISGADGTGALYTAVFQEARWEKPTKVLELRRPCDFVLFELDSRPHLLECGSGRQFFAALEADAWKPLPYPLPAGAVQPAVAAGPGKSVSLVFIAGTRRVSRTPREGALHEVVGKAFLITVPAEGRPGSPLALDPTSQSRAAHPVVAVGPGGAIHVLVERSYGPAAKPNIGHIDAKKPGSVLRTSRQPGNHPALAALSERELLALWNDRPGVVQSFHTGRAWDPPTVIVSDAADPHLHRGPGGRLHLTVFTTERSFYYLTRGARGWSTPINFGPAAGAGRAVEAPDGTVHLIWEHGGTFHHRAARPPEDKAPGADGG